jgi:methyltransferase (TIGR00027 family)
MKPISKTAYYCTGVRMLDAASPDPVCNDQYAKLFMDSAALAIFERFKGLTGPNEGNIMRHWIIDDRVRGVVAKDPAARIFLLGAGFDSRAYRLPGGIWTELDQPEVIRLKNERLPASSCKNPLTRVPIDFSEEALRDVLSPFATDEHVVAIVEGVFLYLEREEMQSIIGSLAAVFPNQTLFCELMTPAFFRKYSRAFNDVVKTLGIEFRYIDDRQEELFTDAGYRLEEKISIIGTASHRGHLSVAPRFLVPFLRSAVNGYSVCEFTLGETFRGNSPSPSRA